MHATYSVHPLSAQDMSMPCDVVCIASWNVDLTSHIARPLARGETALGHSFSIGPGGKGSNAAIASARQGAKVAVIASVGQDDFGRMAYELWGKEGIDATQVVLHANQRSGVAQIFVYDDGDNSIAVSPGAGALLSVAQIRAASAVLAEAKVVMASCEVPVEASLEAFRLARRAGSITLLNPAPAISLPEELFALSSIITPNENELRTLAGLGPDAPIEEAALALISKGTQAIAVTLGEKGYALYRKATPTLRGDGFGVKVTDTIGAGDTFTGALAAALARGLPIDQALCWANAAAALSVTGSGAIGGMPTLQATEQFLKAA